MKWEIVISLKLSRNDKGGGLNPMLTNHENPKMELVHWSPFYNQKEKTKTSPNMFKYNLLLKKNKI